MWIIFRYQKCDGSYKITLQKCEGVKGVFVMEEKELKEVELEKESTDKMEDVLEMESATMRGDDDD